MIIILNKKSVTHPNWCEDNYWVEEVERRIVGAVLDGCSTGVNSHFASQAVKYALEKVWRWTVPFDEPLIVCRRMIREVRQILRGLAGTLDLTDMNLLSTVVFFIYDKDKKELFVQFFGDGVVYVNGEEFIHDENNAPDYLAYHMNENVVDFNTYLDSRKVMEFSEVENFSVCTDGIHSLFNVRDGKIPQSVAIDYLIRDVWAVNQKNGLNRKFNILTGRNPETKLSDELYCWEAKDDLTIIRYATI